MADEVSRQDYNSQRTLIGLDSNDEIKNVRLSTTGVVQTFAIPNSDSSAGWTTLRDASVDNSSQTMKAAAGVLGGFSAFNINAEDCWLHFYNAADVSGTPKMSFIIPKGDATSRGSFTRDWGNTGIGFTTAIRYNAVAADDGANPGVALEMTAWYL